jgi:hypothetical protein
MATGALDFVSLDRDVARAHAAVLRFRAALRSHPDSTPADPLAGFRHVAGRVAYDALRAYPASLAEEPLSAGLLLWMHALLEVRTGYELEASLARETRSRRGPVMLETPREVSYEEAWRGAVEAKDLAARVPWLEAAASLAPPLAPLAREAAERRSEVGKRLGLRRSATEEGGELPAEGLEPAARALLLGTKDLRAALRREAARDQAIETPMARLAAFVDAALARDASEGWPARLTSRWFEEILPEACKDARLSLELPRAVGASSFARGLYLFGVAVREGGRSALPFSIAKSPQRTDAHRLGFVFGALPARRAFHKKVLGLGDRSATRQARLLARTALCEAVLTSARWLLTRDGHLPSRVARDEVLHDVFDGPIDVRYAGAWPGRKGDETPRLEALLTAEALAGELVSRFDVDWYRNPRAGAFLRARAAGPARIEPAKDVDPTALAKALARTFEEALG